MLCKAQSPETDKRPNPRFENVKSYPALVLNEVFEWVLALLL
jgi:hypothetical protein